MIRPPPVVDSTPVTSSSTYKYRDQEKRTAYQREYMRGWRTRQKEKSHGAKENPNQG